MLDGLEWALLARGLVIVAAGQDQWFLHQPSVVSFGDPFVVPMSESGTTSTTQGLLDGAITAGMARPPEFPVAPNPLTPAMLVYSLTSNYHTTHRTPATFIIAARQAA